MVVERLFISDFYVDIFIRKWALKKLIESLAGTISGTIADFEQKNRPADEANLLK